MRTLDVTPTIADLLDTKPRWRHDGRSAFDPVTRRRREVALPTRDFSRVIRIGLPEMLQRRAANRRRRAALVGTGAESDLLFGSPVGAALPGRDRIPSWWDGRSASCRPRRPARSAPAWPMPACSVT